MKRQLVLTCLLVLSLGWSIRRQRVNGLSQRPVSYGNLQFSNYSGGCLYPSEINAFKSAVNDAANLYGNSVQSNLRYITKTMNTPTVMNDSQIYLVFIQKTPSVITFWSIYSSAMCSISTFSGINKYNANWSYMLVQIYFYDKPSYDYVTQLGWGQSIRGSQITAINSMISGIETDPVCDCGLTSTIQTNLRAMDRQYWNVLCDNVGEVGASFTNDGQWGYIKPAACYYLIYVV